MWDGFEARKFPRVKADCQIHIEHPEQGKVIAVKTENIGIGGFCVILSQALPKLSQVRVELDLQDGNHPISCDGRVVWTVASKTFGSSKLNHDTGVEFVNIPEFSRERIRRLLNV